MKSQRKPVEIFSFSFLDVIACGVGVILFITILSISQAVSQGDPELLEQLEASKATEETLERMAGQVAENIAKQKEMKAANDALEKLRAEIAAFQSQATLATQYEQLRQQYEVAKAALEQMNTLAQAMPTRSPVARSTNKRPMAFLSFFGEDKVRVAHRVNRDFLSDDYLVEDEGQDRRLTEKGNGRSVKSILESNAPLAGVLGKLDQSQHYVECYVEPDGFEDFIKIRTMLQTAGWDVGFMFQDDASELVYGPGGSASKVQ